MQCRNAKYKWTQPHRQQTYIFISPVCVSCRPRGAVWRWRVEPVSVPIVWGPWCTAAEGTGCGGESLSLRGGAGQSHGGPAQTQVSDFSAFSVFLWQLCLIMFPISLILVNLVFLFLFLSLQCTQCVALLLHSPPVASRGTQWTQYCRNIN